MTENPLHLLPLEKSIIRIAGDQHHISELQKLEGMLYSKFDLNKLYDELIEFLEKEFPDKTAKQVTIKDLQRIDEFIKKQTLSKITIAEQFIVRSFVIGHIIEARQETLTSLIVRPKIIELNSLPDTIKSAAKEYNLSTRQIEAMDAAMSHTAQHLVSATNATVNRVQSLTADNILKQGSRRELVKKLKEEFFDSTQEINRNWNRVAIYETSYAYNNGYLSSMKPGQWVIGISMPDRCDTCGKLIDGKVYYYTSVTNEEMKYDELDPRSKEYKRRAWLSENTIWLYKDNYGLSSAKNKRVEEGMVPRMSHELSKPCCPQHIACRCSWSRFIPDAMFVTRDGKVKMKAMDEKAWKQFYETKIQPVMEKLKEYGVIK
jgi:hypothetical protein